MNSPKILVGTPLNDAKNYIIMDWLASLSKITYDNIDIMLVDNSITTDNYKMLLKMGYNVKYYDPANKTIKQVIAGSRNILREYAIKNNFDYIFSLECDVFPPNNAIEKLLLHNRPVVSGFYLNGSLDSNFTVIQKQIGHIGHKFHTVHNYSVHDGFMMSNGKVVPVYTAGLGCVLISKSVFSELQFKAREDQDGTDDVFFAEDLYHLNIPFLVDTSILCTHMNQSYVQFHDKKLW
jgi:hypothetical protein